MSLTGNINIVGFDVSGGVGDIQTVSCVYFNEHELRQIKVQIF